MARGDSISIVIPSRSEGETLLACIEGASRLAGVSDIVVAAHGESEATRARATSRSRVRWIECRHASRGCQLNRGTRLARGDVLLFLHADSSLPADATARIRTALVKGNVVGGAFRLAFDARHPALNLLERLSGLGITASFLGDQGIFCRRETFDALGGFLELRAFEDVEFMKRLARKGRLARLDSRVRTSARRFAARGPWRQLARNAWLFALYHAGVSPRRLAARYSS